MERSLSNIKIREIENMDEASLVTLLYNLETLYWALNKKAKIAGKIFSFFLVISIISMISDSGFISADKWPHIIVYLINFGAISYGIFILIDGIYTHFKIQANIKTLKATIDELKKVIKHKRTLS